MRKGVNSLHEQGFSGFVWLCGVPGPRPHLLMKPLSPREARSWVAAAGLPGPAHEVHTQSKDPGPFTAVLSSQIIP